MNAYMKVDLNDSGYISRICLRERKTPEEVLSSWDTTFEELMKSKGIRKLLKRNNRKLGTGQSGRSV